MELAQPLRFGPVPADATAGFDTMADIVAVNLLTKQGLRWMDSCWFAYCFVAFIALPGRDCRAWVAFNVSSK